MENTSGIMIKLKSPNYCIWKPKMEDILYCNNLYDPIESDSAKLEDKTEKEWESVLKDDRDDSAMAWWFFLSSSGQWDKG